MSTKTLSGPAVVGQFYMVPCVRLLVASPINQHPAAGRYGWIPTLGPEHHDREVIGFQSMHLHVDVRFVSDSVIQRNYFGDPARLMGHPVSTFSDGVHPYGCHPSLGPRVERSVRRMKCRREAQTFPHLGAIKWMPKLEAEHAGCKLKPGNICPHRGIDLTPFIKEDGTVICPGHGLRWNTNTGDLMPHQAL